jgi:hypothetical protein
MDATARNPHRPQRLPSFSVVVTTTGGGPELPDSVHSLLGSAGQPPLELIIVDSRPPSPTSRPPELPAEPDWKIEIPIRILSCAGPGPAAARNAGWLAASADWVVFLDEEVIVSADWAQHLIEDLGACTGSDAAVTGRVSASADGRVSTADHGRPSSYRTRDRSAADRSGGDIAVRRSALYEIGGFDETLLGDRREVCDLMLRILDAGYRIRTGGRRGERPRSADQNPPAVQRRRTGADDAVMLARHGYRWRRRLADRSTIGPGGRRSVTGMISSRTAPSANRLYYRLRGEFRARFGAAARPHYATSPNPNAPTSSGRRIR